MYLDEFGHKYCDFPRVERWNYELLVSSVNNMINNFETFRDDYQDSDSILKGVQEWQLSAQHRPAARTPTVIGLHEQVRTVTDDVQNLSISPYDKTWRVWHPQNVVDPRRHDLPYLTD